jgi:hypothetical protein
MPTKCIDQMPTPMAKPPPSSQAHATRPVAARSCTASASAVYEAKIATTIEAATRPG